MTYYKHPTTGKIAAFTEQDLAEIGEPMDAETGQLWERLTHRRFEGWACVEIEIPIEDGDTDETLQRKAQDVYLSMDGYFDRTAMVESHRLDGTLRARACIDSNTEVEMVEDIDV